MAIGVNNINSDVIKPVLGENSDDTGTLCKSGRINKWAKYKPFHWANTRFVDLIAGTNYRGPEIDYGHLGYRLAGRWCGLQPFVRHGTYPADIAAAYDNETDQNNPMNGWVFLLPTGDAASPYRIGDFRSYEHNPNHTYAECPFYNWYTNAPSFVVRGSGEFVACYNTGECYSGLSPYDFTALNNMYFGVLVKVFNGSTTTYYLKTQSEIWLAQDPGDTIDVSGISDYFAGDRNHDFYPVLSTVGNYSGLATQSGALLVTFPNYKKITKFVWSSRYYFEFVAYYKNDDTNKIVMYLVCFNANEQASCVISDIKIYYDSTSSFPSSVSSYQEYENDSVDYSGYNAIKMTSSASIMRQTRTVRERGSAYNAKDIMYLNGGSGADTYTLRKVKDASGATEMYAHIEFIDPDNQRRYFNARVTRESN